MDSHDFKEFKANVDAKAGPIVFQGQSMQIRQDIEEGGSPFRNELRVVVCFEGVAPGLLSNEHQ